VTELEQTTGMRIDFGKVQAAAGCHEPLVPVVVQDADTLEVLFVGHATAGALDETLRTGQAVLWSASRDELWRKGDSSGDVLDVGEVRVNCEQNSLLFLVRPRQGGACHTSDSDGRTRRTCYYRRIGDNRTLEFLEGFTPAG
jgi:phosphoribosyl-AMP cyclohydrolase